MDNSSSELRQRLVGSGSIQTAEPVTQASTLTRGFGSHKRRLRKIIRQGISMHLADAYFHLLSLPFMYLVPALLTYFLVNSLAFAGLYYAVPGTMSRDGTPVESFFEHFYVAMAVMSDTDSGVSVDGIGKQLLYLIEGITQLVSLAVLVGVVVDRVTHPHVRIKFAERAILGWYNRKPCLQLRFAWERNSRLLDSEVKVYVFEAYKTAEGESGRRMVELKLQMSKMPMFFLTWNVRHVIDEASPLFGLLSQIGFDQSCLSFACGRATGLQAPIVSSLRDLELLVYFRGKDTTQRETLRAIHTYSGEDIEVNAMYEDVINHETHEDGSMTTVLNLRRLNNLIPIRPPTLAELQRDTSSAVLVPAAGQPSAGLPMAQMTSPASAMHGLFLSPQPTTPASVLPL